MVRQKNANYSSLWWSYGTDLEGIETPLLICDVTISITVGVVARVWLSGLDHTPFSLLLCKTDVPRL